MARLAHEEHELRRVIDEDREVEGLGEQDLLELYRSMVLLRTYDERSVIYHRQGRIGTYAIFWRSRARGQTTECRERKPRHGRAFMTEKEGFEPSRQEFTHLTP